MAKRRGEEPGKRGAPVRSESLDLRSTLVRITASQWDALRREALQRALEGEKGDRRPDASKLIREAIDEWLAKRAR
jgi:hypothetical protein